MNPTLNVQATKIPLHGSNRSKYDQFKKKKTEWM